jgi:two-component system sensor kinase FixL
VSPSVQNVLPSSLVPGNFNVDDSFRLMVESVVDYALFMLDPRGRIVTWNLGAERIKLYHAEEIIGKHFSIFYPAESIEDGLPERELSMATAHGRHEDEGWRIRKGGTRFWANVVITAMRDSQGQLVGFAKATRDLTERRRAEQGLAAAYDQVNSVLECTSDGVIKIDRNWNLVYGNAKAVKSLPDFFIGKNYWACFPEVRGTPLEQTLHQAMRDRSEASYEIYYPPYQQWYRGNVHPIHDGIIIFFTNVTAEKTLQEEVELTRFLKEKRIEALSHMAGGLAHEINNPLAIIHGAASDLLHAAEAVESLPADKVRMACQRIVKTSDRATRILHGLKGFGREASKDPMDIASLYEIVDQCLELQGARFERHDVDLRIDLQPDLPYIACRETQIGQIITNLLNNAFDAVVIENGTQRSVTLSAACSKDQLWVDVTDSGPGLEDEVKAHLMEPFFTTKEIGRGMGIGLSLSRAIAQDHGGSLTLRDDTQNTCFRLVLPMHVDADLSAPEIAGVSA